MEGEKLILEQFDQIGCLPKAEQIIRGDDNDPPPLGERHGNDVSCSGAIVHSAGHASGSEDDAEVEAALPELRVKPRDVNAFNWTCPVLALDEDDAWEEDQSIRRPVVPEADVDFLGLRIVSDPGSRSRN